MRPVRIRVLANKDGKIIAVETISAEPEHLRYQAGDQFGALPDQVVHEFEVPRQIEHHDVSTLHRELLGYQVQVREGASSLVRKP